MDACQEDDELNLQKNVADNHSENDHTVGMNFGKHVYIYIYIYIQGVLKKSWPFQIQIVLFDNSNIVPWVQALCSYAFINSSCQINTLACH